MEQRVRPITRAGLAWRIAVAVAGIALLLNGSLRMSDDVWPFGPLSQYAFSPPEDATIVVTRVEGRLVDGRRIDLPLRVGTAGISRAEIEARIPEITADPSLLRSVADGCVRPQSGPATAAAGVAGAGRDSPGPGPQGLDPAGRADHLDGAAMKIGTKIAGWFAPVLPEARVALLRTILYLFVLVDIHLIVRDPIPLSRHPSSTDPSFWNACSICRRPASRSP